MKLAVRVATACLASSTGIVTLPPDTQPTAPTPMEVEATLTLYGAAALLGQPVLPVMPTNAATDNEKEQADNWLVNIEADWRLTLP